VVAWVVGIIIILLGSYLHYQNELHSVNTIAVLSHVGKTARTIGSHDKLKDHKDSIVHTSGNIEISGVIPYDATFDVAQLCVMFKRTVQMYQWKESSNDSKDEDGNSYTDYTYAKEWSANRIESNNFHEKDKANPKFVINDESYPAGGVALKTPEIALSSKFIDQITWPNSQAEPLYKKWHYYSYPQYSTDYNHHYEKPNQITLVAPRNPKIGDLRVSWTCLGGDGDSISVAGQLEKKSSSRYILNEYVHDTSKPSVALLEQGKKTIYTMVESAKSTAAAWTWLWRVLVTIMIVVGFVMSWEPVSTVLRYVPLFGGVFEAGVTMVAVVLGVVWSILIFSVSWMCVRPWMAMGAAVLGLLPLTKLNALKNFFKSPQSFNDTHTTSATASDTPYPEQPPRNKTPGGWAHQAGGIPPAGAPPSYAEPSAPPPSAF